MLETVEHIKIKDQSIAIIVRTSHSSDGVDFLTENTASMQLAYMKRPKNDHIIAHRHRRIVRKIEMTAETLLVRKGRMKIDFFTPEAELICSKILVTGDVVLLLDGGHGMEMLEETELIEIKQGPYFGKNEKMHFGDNSETTQEENIN